MYRIKSAALVCAVLLLLTGCAPRDDFSEYELPDFLPIENVTAETEFSEYPGDTETIYVFITNNSEEYFYCGDFFFLEKSVNGKWKPIKTSGVDLLLGYTIPAHSEGNYCKASLKDFVKLPLLPGQYRVWVGSGDGTVESSFFIPAEFTVK